MSQASYFYLPSLSTRTLIYKGLLVPEDIERFYTDLTDKRVVTRLALVHQRFRPTLSQPGIWHNPFVICVTMAK